LETTVAASRQKSASRKSSTDTTAAVDKFMSSLEHPHRAVIQRLRLVVCNADPAIAEGVKWNAPSLSPNPDR